MADKKVLQDLLTQLASLSKDELSNLLGEAKKEGRERVAREERAKVAKVFSPLFDAMDKVISTRPDLREYLKEKDAIRLYFANGTVNRENYRAYSQGAFSGNAASGRGNGNRKSVEVNFGKAKAFLAKKPDWADEPDDWQAFASHKKACAALGLTTDGNSPVRVLHAALDKATYKAEDGTIVGVIRAVTNGTA